MPRFAVREGFTLVELLVVIGIIGLLISIALPAFSAATKAARVASTKATLNAIEFGVESFRADAQLGGQYPPSCFLNEMGPLCPEVRSPHNNQRLSGPKHLIGANLLAWALVGADLLGPPGFKDVDPRTRDSFGDWAADCGNGNNSNNVPGLYTLKADGSPYYHRTAPFIEPGKMKYPAREESGGSVKFVCDAFNTRPSLDSICFLDSFDQPILYYKATVGAALWVNYFGAVGRMGRPFTGIYNFEDNVSITGFNETGMGYQDVEVGVDFGAGNSHFRASTGGGLEERLGYVASSAYRSGQPPPATPAPGSFGYRVWNQKVSATPRPYREDSFILLSAGADGLFGTADDIGNFPINP